MGDHMGQIFDGVISGVTEWGLYVELNENKCEGLVPVRELADDFYDFDEKTIVLPDAVKCALPPRRQRQSESSTR